MDEMTYQHNIIMMFNQRKIKGHKLSKYEQLLYVNSLRLINTYTKGLLSELERNIADARTNKDPRDLT